MVSGIVFAKHERWEVMGSRLSDADICRENGWAAGTVLEGDDGRGLVRIMITAVGEGTVLARQISRDGSMEAIWTLKHREWREVK